MGPTNFSLGAMLVAKSLKLLNPSDITARSVPLGAKCSTCKSAEGDLRACSFCKAGIYHDTQECLQDARTKYASLTSKCYPWCCPKCFKKGTAALAKTLIKSAQPGAGAGQKRPHK